MVYLSFARARALPIGICGAQSGTAAASFLSISISRCKQHSAYDSYLSSSSTLRLRTSGQILMLSQQKLCFFGNWREEE
jgi:hypothetical protein